MRYLMGIDNGGSFCKAAIFDENGRQIASASAAVETIAPQPGWAERDLDELWSKNAQVVRQAVLDSGIPPQQIAGVSFSGHGKGLYLVRKDGTPAYHGILSQDTRAWEYVKRWHEDGTAQKVFPRTFQDILVMQHVCLLAWMRDNHPEVLEQTAWIFSAKDYVRFRLTGCAFAEYSDSTGSNLVNLRTGEYDRELLALFGLEDVMDKLPPLRRSSDVCGAVTAQAAAKTLLPEGTPAAAGMFDVDACGIAAGLSGEDDLCMIAGTWSINEYIARAPITDGSVSLNSFFCIPGYYLIEESSPTSAGNLEWFARNLMSCEKAELAAQGKSVYKLLDEWVAELEPEVDAPVYLPYLNGSAEEPLARGSFIGLTAAHDKRHMARAVFEGVVFSHAMHLQKLLKNRPRPASIRLAGGAANSDVWVQMFADALQIPIDVIENKELGAQGAAIAAGIAVGVYPDYPEAIRRTMHITKTVAPRAEYARVYREKFETYCAAAQLLRSLWPRFQGGVRPEGE